MFGKFLMWTGMVIWFLSFNDSVCLLLLFRHPTVISDKYNSVWMTAKRLQDSVLITGVGTARLNLVFPCIYVFILISLTHRFTYNSQDIFMVFWIWLVKRHTKHKNIELERYSVVKNIVCSSRVRLSASLSGKDLLRM